MAGVVGAVVVAAGAIGAAAISADSSRKAAHAQADALKAQKGTDIPDVQALAAEADKQKYKDQFTILNEVDPATGQLRDSTNFQLNKYATNDAGQQAATGVLSQLFDENHNPDATDTQFYNTLRTQAQQQLDLGGSLSPAQQSEFVRAGLEGASTSGLNPASAATRQKVGGLLASESTALQAQRQQQAQSLFGFATQLKDNRNAQLSSIGNFGLQTSAANGSKLLNLAQLADSRVPEIGLGGGDVANLSVANTNQKNGNLVAMGQVNAQRAVADGKTYSNLIGGLTSAVGGYGAAKKG